MKKIYFVRHGQSEGNTGPIRQTKDTPLTEHGHHQAQFVAERSSKLAAEAVVSSTMVRARQTAEYILSATKLPVDYSDLFVERRRGSEVLGKPKDDPVALETERVIIENFAKPGFRYSDEENFDDLKQRAKDALAYLANRPEEKIIVVTHGFFMKVIMAYVLFGEDLTGVECEKFIRNSEMENTAVTVVDGKQKPDGMRWWLWIWNDHSHLG